MNRACRALESKPPNSKDSPKTSQRPVGSQHWRRKWNFKFKEFLKVKIVILSLVADDDDDGDDDVDRSR